MPKISIIIPVYNGEKYIRRCMKSLEEQTFSDFEVIFVDDGSTDGSGNICDECASHHGNVTVLHQVNKGVSAARNNGIKASTGDWLAYIDVDDVVEPDYLESLHKTAEDTGADIVISGFKPLFVATNKEGTPYAYPNRILQKNEYIDLFRKYNFKYITFPHGKLFRASKLRNNVEFSEGVSWNEDSLYNYSCLAFAERIALTDYIGYTYMMHDDSLSHMFHQFEAESRGFELMSELAAKMEKTYGREIYDHINLYEFLRRSVISLYGRNYSKQERMAKLKSLKFKARHIKYKPKNIKERVLHTAMIYKWWGIVDRILAR